MNNNAAIDPWKEVVSNFRSLCFNKLQGKSAVSETILRQQLPKKIAEWSQSNTDDAAGKKARLEEMFRTEQRRVDDVYTLHELSAMQWREDLLPALTSQISQQIRQTISEQFASLNTRQAPAPEPAPQPMQRSISNTPLREKRINFDDIPAIFDLLADEERKKKANFAA